ncbi:MAG: hypothetical protein ACLFO2_02785 [Candidatus Woesearchaeota archaeon]
MPETTQSPRQQEEKQNHFFLGRPRFEDFFAILREDFFDDLFTGFFLEDLLGLFLAGTLLTGSRTRGLNNRSPKKKRNASKTRLTYQQ